MWIYMVIFLALDYHRADCPNGVSDCSVYHAKMDTVEVASFRYCERNLAAQMFKVNKKSGKIYVHDENVHYKLRFKNYDFIKLDSIYVNR